MEEPNDNPTDDTSATDHKDGDNSIDEKMLQRMAQLSDQLASFVLSLTKWVSGGAGAVSLGLLIWLILESMPWLWGVLGLSLDITGASMVTGAFAERIEIKKRLADEDTIAKQIQQMEEKIRRRNQDASIEKVMLESVALTTKILTESDLARMAEYFSTIFGFLFILVGFFLQAVGTYLGR